MDLKNPKAWLKAAGVKITAQPHPRLFILVEENTEHVLRVHFAALRENSVVFGRWSPSPKAATQQTSLALLQIAFQVGMAVHIKLLPGSFAYGFVSNWSSGKLGERNPAGGKISNKTDALFDVQELLSLENSIGEFIRRVKTDSVFAQLQPPWDKLEVLFFERNDGRIVSVDDEARERLFGRLHQNHFNRKREAEALDARKKTKTNSLVECFPPLEDLHQLVEFGTPKHEFLGRKKFLEWIGQQFCGEKPMTVLLDGYPGVGKTATAIAFVRGLLREEAEKLKAKTRIRTVHCLFRRQQDDFRYGRLLPQESPSSHDVGKALVDHFVVNTASPDSAATLGHAHHKLDFGHPKEETLIVIDGWSDEISPLLHHPALRGRHLLITTHAFASRQESKAIQRCIRREIRGHPYLSQTDAKTLLCSEGSPAAALGAEEIATEVKSYERLVEGNPLALLSSAKRLDSLTVEGVKKNLNDLIEDTKLPALRRRLRNPATGSYRYRLLAIARSIPKNSQREAHLFLGTSAWLLGPSSASRLPLEKLPTLSEPAKKNLAWHRAVFFPEHVPGESAQVVILPFLGRELLWEWRRICEAKGAEQEAAEGLLKKSLACAFEAVLPPRYGEAGKWPEYLKDYEGDSGVLAGEQLFDTLATAHDFPVDVATLRRMTRLARRLIAYHCASVDRANEDTPEHAETRRAGVERIDRIADGHAKFIADKGKTLGEGDRVLFQSQSEISQVFLPVLRHRLEERSRTSDRANCEKYLMAAYQHALRAALPRVDTSGFLWETKWELLSAENWLLVTSAKLRLHMGDKTVIPSLVEKATKLLDRRGKLAEERREAVRLGTGTRAATEEEKIKLEAEIVREEWRHRCVIGYLRSQGEQSDETMHFWKSHGEGLALKATRADPADHSARGSIRTENASAGEKANTPSVAATLSFDERFFLAMAAFAIRRDPDSDPLWQSPLIDLEIVALVEEPHFTIVDSLATIVRGALLARPKQILF